MCIGNVAENAFYVKETRYEKATQESPGQVLEDVKHP